MAALVEGSEHPEGHPGLRAVAGQEPDDGRNHAGRAVCRGGDHAMAGRVLLVDRQGVEIHPVHCPHRVRVGGGPFHGVREFTGLAGLAFTQPLRQGSGAAQHVEAPGQDPVFLEPRVDAVEHRVRHEIQIGIHLFLGAHGDLVLVDQLGDR